MMEKKFGKEMMEKWYLRGCGEGERREGGRRNRSDGRADRGRRETGNIERKGGGDLRKRLKRKMMHVNVARRCRCQSER